MLIGARGTRFRLCCAKCCSVLCCAVMVALQVLCLKLRSAAAAGQPLLPADQELDYATLINRWALLLLPLFVLDHDRICWDLPEPWGIVDRSTLWVCGFVLLTGTMPEALRMWPLQAWQAQDHPQGPCVTPVRLERTPHDLRKQYLLWLLMRASCCSRRFDEDCACQWKMTLCK